MFVLDLFNTKFEQDLNEGAVDNLEARRIDDLNMRMLELLDRAKEPAYKKNPAALAGLKKQFQQIKSERDSYFKINPATGMNDTGTLGTVKGRLDDGQVTPTATGLRHHAKPENYGGYEPERELKGLNKTLTKNLEKGMGIEFKKGGQGNRIQPDVDEAGIPGNVPVEKIPGKEDLLKGKGRSYYESQKKNSEAVAEQSNPEDDDWYDDEEDQETELRSGDYVRDTMDGEYGEVFRMQGDPYERRVRILDRDGRGWYIEPSRLVVVDRNDPDIQRYFGKQRVRDMDEGWKSTVGGAALAGAMALGAGGAQARVAGDNVDNPDVNRLTGKPNVAQTVQGDQAKPTAPSGYSKAYLQSVVDGSHPRPMVSKEKAQELLNQLREQGVSEGWSDAAVARRTGSPRTPYTVYIKGRKWKDFESDDHAEAVANKLRAKFRAEGRDPSVITVAPTDMSEAKATKTRLDPKCWTGKKIGNPKTKVKGGVRVNNCVPAESINEEQDSNGVERAILNRIMVAHTDLLRQFGPEKVMQAAEEVAYNVGDVDEIGTSDVSAYVHQVRQILGAV